MISIERITAEARRREERRVELQREIERLTKEMDTLDAEQARIEQEAERISARIEEQVRQIIQQSIRAGLAERMRRRP